MSTKRIAILGSTGSIGRQALEVISGDDALSVCALAANSGWKLLGAQAAQFGPAAVALTDPAAADNLDGNLPEGTELLSGPDAMTELVRTAGADIVLTGVVGSAGLEPTLAAIECGSTLAIANKETLVMAGAIVIPAARRAGLDVLPVDSEHSAIFQCLRAGRRGEVSRVVITASGGSLRDWPERSIENATIADALNHPTWEMGPKITIDSATLINKALEVVEAHWLFDLSADEIEVVVHPESIVHSYVEYRDGSVIAQMGRPDMTTPIAYALGYPHRPARQTAPLDLPAMGSLTFSRPRGRLARAIELGFEAIRRGGLAGAVLNSANEAAVEAFLDGRIPFGRIVPMVEEILNRTPPVDEVTLESLRGADVWARGQVAGAISAPAEQT